MHQAVIIDTNVLNFNRPPRLRQRSGDLHIRGDLRRGRLDDLLRIARTCRHPERDLVLCNGVVPDGDFLPVQKTRVEIERRLQELGIEEPTDDIRNILLDVLPQVADLLLDPVEDLLRGDGALGKDVGKLAAHHVIVDRLDD